MRKPKKLNIVKFESSTPIFAYMYPNTPDHQYDIKCVQNAKDLNLNVYEALQVIRTRLKYGQDVTDIEQETLEQLRKLLGEYYVEG